MRKSKAVPEPVPSAWTIFERAPRGRLKSHEKARGFVSTESEAIVKSASTYNRSKAPLAIAQRSTKGAGAMFPQLGNSLGPYTPTLW